MIKTTNHLPLSSARHLQDFESKVQRERMKQQRCAVATWLFFSGVVIAAWAWVLARIGVFR